MSQNPLNLKRVVEHVLDSLRDPLNPKYCVQYYLYFIHAIVADVAQDPLIIPISLETSSQPLSGYSLATIRSKHPQVLQALMNFLRIERSREEMRAFIQSMESCSCDRSNDTIVDQFHRWKWLGHDVAPGKYVNVFHPRTKTMEPLILALGSLLATPIEESAMHWHQARSWPTSINDVTGPWNDTQRAVTMLCRWMDEYPSIQLAHLIASLAEGELIISTLLHSATLPKSIVQVLNKAYNAMPTNILDLGFGEQMNYKWPFVVMFNFMKRIEGIVDGVSTAYFYDDQAEPLLDVLTRIARVYKGMIGMDMSFQMVCGGTGGTIHAKLVLPYDETKYDGSIIQGSKRMREMQISDADAPYPTAQNILYILTNMGQCSNPACGKANEANDSWQQCSECHRVLYCSSACQQVDWNHREKPHKRTCKTLKAISEAVGFPPSATGPSPPRLSDKDFRARCMQAGEDGSLAKVKKMCQVMMRDDRVLKVLNNEYAKHYDYRLS